MRSASDEEDLLCTPPAIEADASCSCSQRRSWEARKRCSSSDRGAAEEEGTNWKKGFLKWLWKVSLQLKGITFFLKTGRSFSIFWIFFSLAPPCCPVWSKIGPSSSTTFFSFQVSHGYGIDSPLLPERRGRGGREGWTSSLDWLWCLERKGLF